MESQKMVEEKEAKMKLVKDIITENKKQCERLTQSYKTFSPFFMINGQDPKKKLLSDILISNTHPSIFISGKSAEINDSSKNMKRDKGKSYISVGVSLFSLFILTPASAFAAAYNPNFKYLFYASLGLTCGGAISGCIFDIKRIKHKRTRDEKLKECKDIIYNQILRCNAIAKTPDVKQEIYGAKSLEELINLPHVQALIYNFHLENNFKLLLSDKSIIEKLIDIACKINISLEDITIQDAQKILADFQRIKPDLVQDLNEQDIYQILSDVYVKSEVAQSNQIEIVRPDQNLQQEQEQQQQQQQQEGERQSLELEINQQVKENLIQTSKQKNLPGKEN